jgi:hypothetical protein
MSAMRSDADAVMRQWGEVPAAAQDPVAARERLRALEAAGRVPGRVPAPARRFVHYGRIAGFSAAAALVLAVAFTPVGSYAKGLLLIFQPQSFQAVPLARSEVGALPKLGALGNLQGMQRLRLLPVANVAAAQAAAGFQVAVASDLPAGFDAPVYGVLPQNTDSLTLSASKIADYAAQHHVQLPPLPADLAGSTISVTTGPAVVTLYGRSLTALTAGSGMPQLLIAQAPAPKVYSTGATVQEMEQYFLSVPGVSPQLAAEIKAIGNPTRTLPIPIPLGKVGSQPVAVQGAQGLAISAKTGIGSGIVWQKGGMMYAVLGSLPESELLTVAQGLR